MKTILGLLVLTSATLAFAQPATPPAAAPAPPPASGPTCYELSASAKTWSKTPERMCIGEGAKNVEIKLTTGMPTATEVAVFHLDRTSRARCPDCNKDIYALSNPENSVFNQLKISFNGKRDMKTGAETGTLTVGKTKFFYRSVK